MRILLSGSTGLLGHQFAKEHQEHDQITALVREVPNDPIPGVRYAIADFSKDCNYCDDLGQYDAIVHLAQSRNFRNFPDSGPETFLVNTFSTSKLLDFAARVGVEKFVLASTGGLYAPSTGALRESDPLLPPGVLDSYFASKLAAEALAGSYSNLLEVSVLRFFFIYGPRQDSMQLMPRLVTSVREGRPIRLSGQDGLLFNPVHVSDAVRGLSAVLSHDLGLTVNIAGAESISMRQLCSLLGDLLGKAPVFQEGPIGRDFNANVDKLISLGATPLYSLSRGLEELVKSL